MSDFEDNVDDEIAKIRQELEVLKTDPSSEEELENAVFNVEKPKKKDGRAKPRTAKQLANLAKMRERKLAKKLEKEKAEQMRLAKVKEVEEEMEKRRIKKQYKKKYGRRKKYDSSSSSSSSYEVVRRKKGKSQKKRGKAKKESSSDGEISPVFNFEEDFKVIKTREEPEVKMSFLDKLLQEK